MKYLKFLFFSITTILLILILDNKIEKFPPLGRLINPFTGFWQNSAGKNIQEYNTKSFNNLKDSVTVLFDSLMVPHIEAQNEYDLYFTQGYITASMRLWQMEFQTMVAAGRLSEIVGSQTLEMDRYNRSIGMVYGARNALDEMLQDSSTALIINAYADGINEYIKSLKPKNYPLEYKILDYNPEQWTPLKTSLLLMFMTYNLSGHSDDLYLSNIKNKYGMDVINELYPSYPYKEEPIISAELLPEFKQIPITSPQITDTSITLKDFLLEKPNPENGSNNWAISAKKSSTGYPILANDPHLELNLPSNWYQVQLTAPGLNVYGVSLPGAPTVIVGFNEQIAWGVTNVGWDVMDFYKIVYKDESKKEYLYSGEWKPTKFKIEEIKVRGKNAVYDTIRYTHHGPIVYESNEKPFKNKIPVGYALRWIGHERTNALKAFSKLNKAKNYEDFVNAISNYGSPAQNFAFADKYKNIALWVNGKLPMKWKDQGKFILDGNNPLHEWKDMVPHHHVPHIKNPLRGFVSSANQFPADTNYPYFLGWQFAPYERGARINEVLIKANNFNADSMIALQNDNMNLFAKSVLPLMLSQLNNSSFDKKHLEAFRYLKSWSYVYDKESIAATIFENWWKNFMNKTWKDEFGEEGLLFPTRDVTFYLMTNKPKANWFDNIKTTKKETLKDLIQGSFISSIDSLLLSKGENINNWKWGIYKATQLNHLARIPGLGVYDIEMGGNKGLVNATSERHGPSWKMVVELGPKVNAFGIYPGGQSGNPGSYYYDNMIEAWSQGKLYPILFYEEKHKQKEGILLKLIYTPDKK